MPSKYNGVFFRKERVEGEEGRGQTPPTIVVITIDYTSPEKLQRHSHVSFMQITRKQQHPDTHRLIGNWSLPLHRPGGKARIFIKHNTHGNIVLFYTE